MSPNESLQGLTPSLFRKEALQHRARRLEGEVLLGAPLSWTALGYLAVTVVAAALTFASLSTYARKETVAGWLVPHAGLIRVSTRSSGVVEDLGVREGDDVRKGAVLARVRLAVDSANGDSGEIEIEAVREEIDASSLGARSRMEKLEVTRDQLERQHRLLTAQRAEAARYVGILEAKLALAQDGLGRAQELVAQGYLSRHELDRAMSSLLTAQEDVSAARSDLLSLDQKLVQVGAQIASHPILIAQATSEAEGRQAVLRQKLEQATAGNVHALTSPISGKVAVVPLDVGQAVKAGATIVMLTPSKSPLEAELFIPSRAAGFIRTGQSVSLQYQAFPFQKFGSANGVIVSMSRTPLNPEDIALPTLRAQEPLYRARIALEREHISAYGANVPLRAGMLLRSDVVVERRSLIEWLLDPLYAVGKRR